MWIVGDLLPRVAVILVVAGLVVRWPSVMLHCMTEDRWLSTLSAVGPLSCHREVMILSTSADVISEMGMEAIFSQCPRDEFQLSLVSYSSPSRLSQGNHGFKGFCDGWNMGSLLPDIYALFHQARVFKSFCPSVGQGYEWP